MSSIFNDASFMDVVRGGGDGFPVSLGLSGTGELFEDVLVGGVGGVVELKCGLLRNALDTSCAVDNLGEPDSGYRGELTINGSSLVEYSDGGGGVPVVLLYGAGLTGAIISTLPLYGRGFGGGIAGLPLYGRGLGGVPVLPLYVRGLGGGVPVVFL